MEATGRLDSYDRRSFPPFVLQELTLEPKVVRGLFVLPFASTKRGPMPNLATSRRVLQSQALVELLGGERLACPAGSAGTGEAAPGRDGGEAQSTLVALPESKPWGSATP